MGITAAFNSALTGITAQRIAIEVTSENIANVNTPGYSRQRAIMETRPGSTSNGITLGSGVSVVAVERSYDRMLQAQIVNGNSTYQQNLTRQTALQQAEPSFNELTADGLGAAVDKFFNSWQDLSTNAQGTSERQALLVSSQTMVDTFHQMNTNLKSVITASDNSLVGIAADVSDKAKNIALINNQILTTTAVGGNPNELMDQRDYLVQELAKKVGITSTEKSDGTVSVALAGGGQQLVDGLQYSTVYTNKNALIPPTNDVFVTKLGNPPPVNTPLSDANITLTVGGNPTNKQGEIGGAIMIRDTTVPGYLTKLDEMASNLVTVVNAQHRQGYNLNGATGINFFDPAGITSASIQIDPALTSNSIAAGLPTATDIAPTSPSNNVNALAIAGIRNTSIAFTGGTATIGGFYNSLVSSVGIDVQGAQNVTKQGEAFLKQMNTLRESNAGVSLDEELTNLIKYQKAFQGASKVISIGAEMLDSVLGIIR